MLTLVANEAGQTVEASLHEDAAAAVLTTVTDGQRVTLKCFCEGFDQRVRLKSCVVQTRPVDIHGFIHRKRHHCS